MITAREVRQVGMWSSGMGIAIIDSRGHNKGRQTSIRQVKAGRLLTWADTQTKMALPRHSSGR